MWRREDKCYCNFEWSWIECISICPHSSYNVIAHETKRIHFIIILYTLNETCTNPKLFTSFVPHPFPNRCLLTFPPCAEAVTDKNQRSRISSFAIHPYSWIALSFISIWSAAGSRNKSISPLEYIGKVCTPFECTSALFSLVPRSVTRFVPRRSRKNTREARSPRLCPLCQRRRRNYFAATVDGNAAVWVRRRSREAALACLPRISYFLGGIRDSFPPGEEVGPASSVSSRSWLNWTGEFFSPFLEMKLSRRVSGKKRRFVPGLESKEIGLFEATCCCCVSNLNFDRRIFYFIVFHFGDYFGLTVSWFDRFKLYAGILNSILFY